jgi:hypothetical protein
MQSAICRSGIITAEVQSESPEPYFVYRDFNLVATYEHISTENERKLKSLDCT